MYNVEELQNLQDMLNEIKEIEKCEKQVAQLNEKISNSKNSVPNPYVIRTNYHKKEVAKKYENLYEKHRKRVTALCSVIYTIFYILICGFLTYRRYYKGTYSADFTFSAYIRNNTDDVVALIVTLSLICVVMLLILWGCTEIDD